VGSIISARCQDENQQCLTAQNLGNCEDEEKVLKPGDARKQAKTTVCYLRVV
jgi:hypothetical protein